jgi:hypothetical protein
MPEWPLQFFSAIQHSPPAVAGLFSGILGSFVADWSKWGFESRRDRREARRRLIEQARDILADPPPKEDFRETSLYFQLSPYLLAETKAKMTSTLLTGGEVVELDVRGNKVFVNPYSDLILKDLVALERKWGLI